jgi:hypothetical protein
MPKLSYKATQFLRVLVKLLIVGAASYMIWKYLQNSRVFKDQNFSSIIKKSLTYRNIGILLLFTVFNWIIEIIKWRTLASKVREIAFSEAIIQSLTAHVSSFITPVKMGDFGAKAMYFIPERRKKILFLSFLGNFYQMLSTLVFGLLGIGHLIFGWFPRYRWHYICIVILGVLIWRVLPQLLDRIRWSFKGFSWQRIQEFTKTLTKSRKQKVIGLSFLKFLVFAHQFYFLLTIFDIHLGYWHVMSLICAMYLISSLLPIAQLLDVVVRGGVALLIFGLASVDESVILTITFIMWFLNVALPMLPGSYFVITFKPLSIQNSDIR